MIMIMIIIIMIMIMIMIMIIIMTFNNHAYYWTTCGRGGSSLMNITHKS